MLIQFQKRLKPLARKLSVAFVGLWLFSVASPCVLAANDCPPGMVMTHCAHGDNDTAQPGDKTCSEWTKFSCQLPDRSNPSVSSVPSDFTMLPVLLAVLPAMPEPPLLTSMRRVVHAPASVSFTPLHVSHTVLLI